MTINVSKVYFVEEVDVLYALVPDKPHYRRFTPSIAIGNFEGHTYGVDVTDNGDGTYDMAMDADFKERWYRVPISAVRLEGGVLSP